MKINLINSSLFKKFIMAFSGLFLCSFLIVHLIGNLQLLLPSDQARIQFNNYAAFMSSNPIIKLASIFTFFSFLIHAIYGIILFYQNRFARPIKYLGGDNSKVKIWSSKYMVALGIIILFFLIIHLKSFWYEMKFGALPLDEKGNKDLYTITLSSFKDKYYTVFYLISMISIGFHLHHGFKSGFQSIGLTSKFKIIINLFNVLISWIVPILYGLLTVLLYLK